MHHRIGELNGIVSARECLVDGIPHEQDPPREVDASQEGRQGEGPGRLRRLASRPRRKAATSHRRTADRLHLCGEEGGTRLAPPRLRLGGLRGLANGKGKGRLEAHPPETPLRRLLLRRVGRRAANRRDPPRLGRRRTTVRRNARRKGQQDRPKHRRRPRDRLGGRLADVRRRASQSLARRLSRRRLESSAELRHNHGHLEQQ